MSMWLVVLIVALALAIAFEGKVNPEFNSASVLGSTVIIENAEEPDVLLEGDYDISPQMVAGDVFDGEFFVAEQLEDGTIVFDLSKQE